MHVATLISQPGEMPVWRYERDGGDFLVKEIKKEDSSLDYIVKTPQKVFYYFPNLGQDILSLINLIERGDRKVEKYVNKHITSIYDD